MSSTEDGRQQVDRDPNERIRIVELHRCRKHEKKHHEKVESFEAHRQATDQRLKRRLEENELASMKGLRIAGRGAALQAANPTDGPKSLFVEPVLVALGLIAIEEH